jgi:hypothetical protein
MRPHCDRIAKAMHVRLGLGLTLALRKKREMQEGRRRDA